MRYYPKQARPAQPPELTIEHLNTLLTQPPSVDDPSFGTNLSLNRILNQQRTDFNNRHLQAKTIYASPDRSVFSQYPGPGLEPYNPAAVSDTQQLQYDQNVQQQQGTRGDTYYANRPTHIEDSQPLQTDDPNAIQRISQKINSAIMNDPRGTLNLFPLGRAVNSGVDLGQCIDGNGCDAVIKDAKGGAANVVIKQLPKPAQLGCTLLGCKDYIKNQ